MTTPTAPRCSTAASAIASSGLLRERNATRSPVFDAKHSESTSDPLDTRRIVIPGQPDSIARGSQRDSLGYARGA